MRQVRPVRWVAFGVIAIIMVGPLYILIANAFKSQNEILNSPLALPQSLNFEYLLRAITAPDFNVVGAYGITAAFAIAVNVLSIAITGPAAYVIARGIRPRHRLALLVLLAGLFIPSQVIVIPIIYVLKTVGLMGTVPGFLLFETTLTIPVSLFLFVAFIQSIPQELDEAARIDGASRVGTFWKVIFPLMRPVVATTVILHTIAVWSDFVNPQIILGPGSGIYTVTTGVFAAINKYSTDFTAVYPNLLLAIAPVIVLFVLLQRQIIGGLTSGAIK